MGTEPCLPCLCSQHNRSLSSCESIKFNYTVQYCSNWIWREKWVSILFIAYYNFLVFREAESFNLNRFSFCFKVKTLLFLKCSIVQYIHMYCVQDVSIRFYFCLAWVCCYLSCSPCLIILPVLNFWTGLKNKIYSA